MVSLSVTQELADEVDSFPCSHSTSLSANSKKAPGVARVELSALETPVPPCARMCPELKMQDGCPRISSDGVRVQWKSRELRLGAIKRERRGKGYKGKKCR